MMIIYILVFSSLFLADCLVGVKTNSFLFVKLNRVIVTQVEFCAISRWSLSWFFSNHKRHFYDEYSIYIAIFSSIFQGVYPVGMTEVRSYFTRMIDITPQFFTGFPPNLVYTEIRFNEPLKCAKFQLDRSMCLYFMADFAKCAKRRKSKVKPETLARISEMAGAIFFNVHM